MALGLIRKYKEHFFVEELMQEKKEDSYFSNATHSTNESSSESSQKEEEQKAMGQSFYRCKFAVTFRGGPGVPVLREAGDCVRLPSLPEHLIEAAPGKRGACGALEAGQEPAQGLPPVHVGRQGRQNTQEARLDPQGRALHGARQPGLQALLRGLLRTAQETRLFQPRSDQG